jgi:hypothetical protein
LQPTYENEMDAWNTMKDNLKVTLKWSIMHYLQDVGMLQMPTLGGLNFERTWHWFGSWLHVHNSWTTCSKTSHPKTNLFKLVVKP